MCISVADAILHVFVCLFVRTYKNEYVLHVAEMTACLTTYSNEPKNSNWIFTIYIWIWRWICVWHVIYFGGDLVLHISNISISFMICPDLLFLFIDAFLQMWESKTRLWFFFWFFRLVHIIGSFGWVWPCCHSVGQHYQIASHIFVCLYILTFVFWRFKST